MNSFTPSLASLAALGVLVIGAAQADAAVISTGTWFAESALDTGVTVSTGSNTISLTNTGGSTANIGAVATLSDEVTLDDVGDFLQFTGVYSGAVGNNINYSIRVGFYDADGLVINADFDDDMNSLIGYFAGLGTRSTTGASTGILRQPLNTSSKVLALEQATPTSNGVTLLGSSVTPISTGNRTVTFRMERLDLNTLQFRLTDGVNVDITRTQAIDSAVTLDFDTLAIGFRLGNNSAATFSDIAVTTIPEPASLALFGLGSLLIVWRKRA